MFFQGYAQNETGILACIFSCQIRLVERKGRESFSDSSPFSFITHIWEQQALLVPYIVVACDYLAKAIFGKAIAVDLCVFMVGFCRFQMIFKWFLPKNSWRLLR